MAGTIVTTVVVLIAEETLSKTTILVVASSDADPPTHFALNNLLNSSPHIANYVKDITVTFENGNAATSIAIPVLEKLGSILSLRINFKQWEDAVQVRGPQWDEFFGTFLRHTSLQRIDLEGYNVLPSTVWHFPALIHIDLGSWYIGHTELDNMCPSLTRRLAMSWLHLEGSQIVLEIFLWISPLLTQLKVSRTRSSFRLVYITHHIDQIHRLYGISDHEFPF